MAISSSGAPVTVRAAAILTGSAVATSPLVSIPQSVSQKVTFFIDFTLGSLTNGIFTPQLSLDGTTWYDVTSPGALTLTATGTKALTIDGCGAKLARMTVLGTGTATSSSATVRAVQQKT